MVLHQTKELLHIDWNYQKNEKVAYWVKENICKWYVWQGINIKNIQRTHTTQHKKKHNPIKNGQKTWVDNFPEKTNRLPTVTGKDAQHH